MTRRQYQFQIQLIVTDKTSYPDVIVGSCNISEGGFPDLTALSAEFPKKLARAEDVIGKKIVAEVERISVEESATV